MTTLRRVSPGTPIPKILPCVDCGVPLVQPKSVRLQRCPECNHQHRLRVSRECHRRQRPPRTDPTWRKKGLVPAGLARYRETHEPKSGAASPQWKGGRYVKQGYVYLRRPEHPRCCNSYVAEHRLVMEESLGRYLVPGELVHHKNGDHGDNRLENLQVLRRGDHGRKHTTGRKMPPEVGRGHSQRMREWWANCPPEERQRRGRKGADTRQRQRIARESPQELTDSLVACSPEGGAG